MSYPASAPRRAAPGASGFARLSVALSATGHPDGVLGAGLALVLLLIALLARGGGELAPNTWEEMALVLGGLAAAVLLLGRQSRTRRHGLATFCLFAALAAYTAASTAWSVQPDDTWVEAGRTVSYLAVFGSAIAGARLLPRRWMGLLSGLVAYLALVSLYALLAKVFPAELQTNAFLGRLSAPFDYWNATGVAAAMGLPGALWWGTRRSGRPGGLAVAVPAVAVEAAVIVLSYSRSAVVAAVIGIAVWLVLVPLRLRSVAVLALGGISGAAVSAWALSTHALTADHVQLSDQISAGHAFGIVLLLVLLLCAAAGLLLGFAADRWPLPVHTRIRIGRGLIASLALLPVAAVLLLATSSRGFGGEVSHIWQSLTSTSEHVNDSPGRLVQLGNSRPLYWSEGLKVARHALLEGTGALGYATARTRYTADPLIVGHAHSYLIQTLADLGLIGVAINLALLAAWMAAAARTFTLPLHRLRPRRRSGQEPDPPGREPAADAGEAVADSREAVLSGTAEWAGLAALLAMVLAYGAQALVDWTWFIPGVTIPALVCAGWIAGRGPMDAVEPHPRLRLLEHPVRSFAAVCAAISVLLVAWVIWQPLRAQQAEAAATAAAAHGDTAAALRDARQARAEDPVAVEPLFELSAIYAALGRRHVAHAELVRAVRLQPENPATWLELGTYDVQNGRPHAAIGVLERAQSLNLSSREIPPLLAQAQAESAHRLAAHRSRTAH